MDGESVFFRDSSTTIVGDTAGGRGSTCLALGTSLVEEALQLSPGDGIQPSGRSYQGAFHRSTFSDSWVVVNSLVAWSSCCLRGSFLTGSKPTWGARYAGN